MTRRAALLVAFAAVAVPVSILPAQTTAAGRVVRPGPADSVPLAGARVLLHRVARDVQGPIDSVLTDAGGRFRFRFRADTAVLYLLSVRHGGIEYFSPPVRTTAQPPDTAIQLVAYDTSSTAPIAVEARHIVVPRAGEDGSRAVLDLIVLRNDGTLTRVAPDARRPTWTMTLPPGTGEMEVGESDFSAEGVVRDGDSVKVVAPLGPGQKQLSLAYAVVPTRGRLEFAMGPNAAPVNVLVEERDARVLGGTLTPVDSQVIEGRTLRRWTGQVPAGGIISVAFAGASLLPAWQVLAALVLPVALVLAVAAWRLLRRPAVVAPADSRDRLLDLIAALDARYAGREGDTPADEWQRYVADRTALMRRLETALAASEPRRYV